MSEIFISYARSTEHVASQIAEALRGLGYGVWRDDALPAHRSFAEVIEERLAAAKAVLVVWSAEAAKSEWVKAEADRAREGRKLVQLRVDAARLPLPFDQIQCADLRDWSGDVHAKGWLQVLDSLAALVGAGDSPPSPRPKGRSVCVLPFSNMSGDAEQEYFSDGITEDIITDLSKVSSLFVVARHTAFAYKNQAVDLRRVADELGVSHLLEGSVRKAGGRVRITAQLIDGATGGHVWAERYDRNLDDIFALQDEISQAIVSALKIRLAPAEKDAIQQRGTANVDAYNLYLMARAHHLSGRNHGPRAHQAVARLCERAVSLDPQYARAWALLATAQGALHYLNVGDETGMSAADQALRLDPDLAEAHAVKARHFSDSRRQAEAGAELEIALRLDPDSYDVNMSAGYYHYRERALGEARTHFERAAKTPEATFDCLAMLISVCAALGDGEAVRSAARQVLALAESVLQSDDTQVGARSYGAYALAALGDEDRAREWIDHALLIEPDNLNLRYNMACAACVYLRNADFALDILGPFMTACTADFLAHAKVDPDLDALRGDKRFEALVADAETRLAATAR